MLWAASLGALHAWTRRMPEEKRYVWARKLSRAARWLFPAKWRAVESNLAVIRDFSGNRFSPEDVFENFALTLADFFSGRRPAVSVEGRERAEETRRQGRGVIFLTSHLGHWELGGRILGDWGWPATAVYKPYRSKAMREFIQKRRHNGLDYLAVGKGAAAGVARRQNQKETVAFVGDRPFGEDGAAVSLCGRETALPRGPFLFACRYGAPILPGFVIRQSPGRYRVVVEEPLWPAGRGTDAVEDLLHRMARVLEKYIARHGDQWYCFEPVWSGKPAVN